MLDNMFGVVVILTLKNINSFSRSLNAAPRFCLKYMGKEAVPLITFFGHVFTDDVLTLPLLTIQTSMSVSLLSIFRLFSGGTLYFLDISFLYLLYF